MIFLSLVLMLAATAFAANLAFTRPRSFALFLLPAGLLYFGADTDSGTAGPLANLSALWLLCLILVSVVAVLRLGGKAGGSFTLVEIAYLAFLGWCAIESLRAADFSFAIRAFLKLLYPFLSMYLAGRAIDSPESASRLLTLQFRMTSTVVVTTFISLFIPIVFALNNFLFWNAAAFFDHVVIIAMLALACWKVRRDVKYLVLAIGLTLICFKAVNRTTVLALALGCSIFSVLAFRKTSVILLPALYMGLMAVLFTVPSFREKMFYKPQEVQTDSVIQSASAVTSSKFNSNGRFAMWDVVLNHFFWPHPVVGSGLGSTQAWFYSGASVDELGGSTIKIEHSEYVKLLSDTGLTGVGLFALAFLLAIAESILSLRRAATDAGRIFAISAICALPVFLLLMAFDNALLYVLPAAQYPLAFAAIASRLCKLKAKVESRSDIRDHELEWLPRRTAGQRFAGQYRVVEAAVTQ